MAIFDAMFELFDDQIVTDTDKTSSVIDMGAGGREMGAGTPLWLNIRTGTAFANGSSLVFTLYNHTASTGLTGGTAVWAVTVAQSVLTTEGAGAYLLRMPLPYNFDALQYVALHITQSGTFSAGTISAWIDHGPQSSYDTQVTTSNI